MTTKPRTATLKRLSTGGVQVKVRRLTALFTPNGDEVCDISLSGTGDAADLDCLGMRLGCATLRWWTGDHIVDALASKRTLMTRLPRCRVYGHAVDDGLGGSTLQFVSSCDLAAMSDYHISIDPAGRFTLKAAEVCTDAPILSVLAHLFVALAKAARMGHAINVPAETDSQVDGPIPGDNDDAPTEPHE